MASVMFNSGEMSDHFELVQMGTGGGVLSTVGFMEVRGMGLGTGTGGLIVEDPGEGKRLGSLSRPREVPLLLSGSSIGVWVWV